jgi:exonuclease VII small subunit
MESVIEEIENIVRDLDYGDITRNDAVKRLESSIDELKEFQNELNQLKDE